MVYYVFDHMEKVRLVFVPIVGHYTHLLSLGKRPFCRTEVFICL